jgi:uncharacterized protein (DUF58 family)
MGKPHIKLYQEERERPVVLLTDFNPSMYFGSRYAFKSVIAARLTAMLAWTAVKQGDWVGGLFFSQTQHNEYPPRAREEGVLTLLKALSDYTEALPEQPSTFGTNSNNELAGRRCEARSNPGGVLRNSGLLRASQRRPGRFDTNCEVHLDQQIQAESRTLLHALKRLSRVARPGSIIILISDFYQLDAECEKLLARLRDHNDVLAYHVCDPLELAPPKPQRYAVTNGREEMLLDTTNRHVTNAYQQYCEDRLATIQQQLKRLRIQYVQVTPEEDIPRLVYDTFPRRAFHG